MLPVELRDRFESRRPLGQGGMGVVVAAWDNQLDREVAIKLVGPVTDPTIRSRALREAQVLARLEHPNVVRLFDCGETSQGIYLVTELVEGISLGAAPSPSDPLATLLPVADALEVAHRAGVLHRDVKPSNVLLDVDGRAVLIDFGLADDQSRRTRLTETGGLVGTPLYASPECLRAEDLTAATDWYGWGATLFWLHERRAPLDQFDFFSVLRGGVFPPPRLERLDPDSREGRLVLACLDQDPAARPSGRAEIVSRLRESSTPRVASRGTTAPVPPVGARRVSALGAVVLAGLGALGVVVSRTSTPEPTLPGPAREGPRVALRAEARGALEALLMECSSPQGALEFPSSEHLEARLEARVASGFRLGWEGFLAALQELDEAPGSPDHALWVELVAGATHLVREIRELVRMADHPLRFSRLAADPDQFVDLMSRVPPAAHRLGAATESFIGAVLDPASSASPRLVALAGSAAFWLRSPRRPAALRRFHLVLTAPGPEVAVAREGVWQWLAELLRQTREDGLVRPEDAAPWIVAAVAARPRSQVPSDNRDAVRASLLAELVWSLRARDSQAAEQAAKYDPSATELSTFDELLSAAEAVLMGHGHPETTRAYLLEHLREAMEAPPSTQPSPALASRLSALRTLVEDAS